MFNDEKVVISDDRTFIILLLVVGLMLMVVSGLMFINTYVTRKHIHSNALAHL